MSRARPFGRGPAPNVCEIWATSDHAVESHAHDSDELLYVVSGAVEIDGQRLGPNEVVFIPGGTSYGARVIGDEGARVLRVELANAAGRGEAPEYDAKVWRGPLTDAGVPHVGPKHRRTLRDAVS